MLARHPLMQGLYLEKAPVLSLYAAGRTTGCVLHVGEDMTHTLAVFEGYALPHASMRTEVGGGDVMGYMSDLLRNKGLAFDTPRERETLRRIVHELAYVALDYDVDVKTAEQSPCLQRGYELPDGRVVVLGEERFCCAEALFDPSLVKKDVEGSGVLHCLRRTIKDCAIDTRRGLYSSILLSGGATLLPGFHERVTKAVTSLAPSSMKVRVLAPPDRRYSAWIGGSVLSALSTFPGMCITRDDYDECGPSVVHRKCPV
jgi:actin, other eukaryote